jgi:hypothetical protein
MAPPRCVPFFKTAIYIQRTYPFISIFKQPGLLMQAAARELVKAQTLFVTLSQQPVLSAETRAELESILNAAKRNILACNLAARGSFLSKKVALDFSLHSCLPVIKFA